MNGRTILGAWAIRSPGRMHAGACSLEFKRARVTPPTLSASPAPSLPNPRRRGTLQSRILSLVHSSLIHVDIGSPGVGGDDLQSCGVPRIFLLSKLAGDPEQDEAESFESVCVISPFRHVPKHGEAGVWKVRKAVAIAGTRYARCS